MVTVSIISERIAFPRFLSTVKLVLVLDVYRAAIRKNFQTQMAEYFRCGQFPAALLELLPRLRASQSIGSINARALSSDPLRHQYGQSRCNRRSGQWSRAGRI